MRKRKCLFWFLVAVCSLCNNMAGLNTSSRSGSRRESLDETKQGDSLASNKKFIQLLRKLPDELERLEREIKKREAKASPSRNEEIETLKLKVKEYERQLQGRVSISPPYSRYEERDYLYGKKIEKWYKEQLETQKKELKREQGEWELQLRKHYEAQLKNNTEILQKNNTKLQNDLKERNEEIETLKLKVKEYERQLQGRVSISPPYSRYEESFTYQQQMEKVKQALEEKRRELDKFKERHAAFSERRVRSDQRRTENTLSTNRQSQLESEYVIEFKDGTRVDAIDIITSRYRGSKGNSMEYLQCCRLACFIFEIAYEVVLAVKESFAAFTCTVMELLVDDAPDIGSDNKAFQNKSWKLQYSRPKETSHTTTQDALSEVMILVKERAKTHDLKSLVQDVKSSIANQWKRRNRDQLLLAYDSTLLHGLNDYIKYCTQFSWCVVTQVPPLKIDFRTAAYSSRSHTVSQAFSFTEKRSPTRRPAHLESRAVLCYLWPTLQDCDGKVLRKGEVILNH